MSNDSSYLSYLVNGIAYAFAGTVALCTVGAIAIRRKMKPKNCWNNQRTLQGSTIVITGGNSGIGAATAKELARRKANVIIACRTRDKSLDLIKEIKNMQPESSEIKYRHLDLSSLKTTKEFVDELTEENVDMLINNAGIWGSPDSESTDGLEQTFATNYLSHFYLTNLMMQKYTIKRVISVSSGLHTQGKINPDDLESLTKVPDVLYKNVSRDLYSTSKLAQIYYARELAIRHPDIQSLSLHPGLVYTDLARYVKPQSFILSLLGRLLPLIIRTPEEGAQTSVYCCVEDGLESGTYYSDCEKKTLKEMACDPDIQRKLWEFSEELIRQKT